MQAVRIHRFGDPEVLQIEEVPTPQPGPGEVLVRVEAAGVVATDWLFRAGLMPGFLGLELPMTPGWDIAGVVETSGAGVDDFAPGTPVYAMLGGQGGYAEYAAVPAAMLACRPEQLDAVAGAAVPLAACTAYKALVETAGLAAGQRVLIHGASGGVGSFAVQIARAQGAYVFAAASTTKLDFVRSLGADEVIDHTAGPLAAAVGDLDVVFDTVGPAVQEKSFPLLKPGGVLVSVAGGQPPAAALAERYRVRGEFVGTEPNGARLRSVSALIDAGKVRPFVDQVLPLTEVRRAHTLLQEGAVRGKIVLKIAP